MYLRHLVRGELWRYLRGQKTQAKLFELHFVRENRHARSKGSRIFVPFTKNHHYWQLDEMHVEKLKMPPFIQMLQSLMHFQLNEGAGAAITINTFPNHSVHRLCVPMHFACKIVQGNVLSFHQPWGVWPPPVPANKSAVVRGPQGWRFAEKKSQK